MIRVTYVLGSHDSRYSQHFKNTTVEAVRDEVQTRMLKSYFDIEVVGGLVRIYSSRVSSIEIRDISNDGPKQAIEAQRKGA